MGYTVISSKPSPFARKVRINLLELSIPFTLSTEVPWNGDTETPQHNPLEKLPILIERDEPPSSSSSSSSSSSRSRSGTGRVTNTVYESKVILEYVNTVMAPAAGKNSLLPAPPRDRVEVRQIEALADGVADALILGFFESRRNDDKQSTEWADRQRRKVDGGLKALDEMVRRKASSSGFLVDDRLSVADLAVGSLLGFLSLRNPDHEWKKLYPELEKYWLKLEERDSFKQTVPETFNITDKVV